jgi:hypothetical protein
MKTLQRDWRGIYRYKKKNVKMLKLINENHNTRIPVVDFCGQ